MTREDERVPTPSRMEFGSDASVTLPSPNSLFDVLANPIRRRILWYLIAEPSSTRGELADVLTGWELEDDQVYGENDRSTLATTLYHIHLPRLVDSGLVEYDFQDDDQEVTLEPLPEPIEDVVRFAYEYEATLETTESG